MTKKQTIAADPPKPEPPPTGPVEKGPRPAAKKKPTGQQLVVVPANLLVLIDRFARDPAVDPVKYRAILDMQKEVRRDEAEREFALDYNRMLPDLPVINRDGRIVIPSKEKAGRVTAAQSTPYATLDNIMTELRPVLAQHHFGFQWASTVLPVGEHGQLQHICTGRLTHDNGVFRESSWPISPDPTGSKNDAQARGSGSGYAKRYTLRDLIPIISRAPEDRDDGGAAVSKPIEAKAIEPEEPKLDKNQCTIVQAVMDENGVTLEVVQKAGWKIKKVEDLKVSEQAKFVTACQDYGKRKKAKAAQAPA